MPVSSQVTIPLRHQAIHTYFSYQSCLLPALLLVFVFQFWSSLESICSSIRLRPMHQSLKAKELRRHLPVLASKSFASRSLEPENAERCWSSPIWGRTLTFTNKKTWANMRKYEQNWTNISCDVPVCALNLANLSLVATLLGPFWCSAFHFAKPQVRTNEPSSDIVALSTGAEWSGNSCKPRQFRRFKK